MAASRRTQFDSVGLALELPIGGVERLPLRGGAMHYYHHDPSTWRVGLKALAKAGYTIVDTYVPWAIHETPTGTFDWSGRRDLPQFLRDAQAAGLRVILRPGPHINAELTHFGFPERIVLDKDMQAKTARDTPAFLPVPPQMFPVPSYASQSFQREVRAWLAEVGRVVVPHLHPDGPVVAIQVDNENQAFFRMGAYDLDYHPDALAWWDEDHPGVEPPRAWNPQAAARCIQWIQFKEQYLVRSLAWLKTALDDAGFAEIAYFANQPPSDPRLVNVPAMEKAIDGPVGFDYYQTARDYKITRRRALYQTGTSTAVAFAPEVGIGGPPWLPPMTEGDQQATILGLIAAGVHAQTHYMAIDRDRWYGGAFSLRNGAAFATPIAAWITTLAQTLDDVGFHLLSRHAPVAVVVSRADARFALASSVIDPLPPILADFLDCGPGGFAELGTDIQARDVSRWFATIEEALARAQLGYDLVDEAAGVDTFCRYRAVILPTLARVDRATWCALREAAGRNTTVVIGPNAPTLDEFGQALGDDVAPPRGVGYLRAESVGDLDGLADDLLALAGSLPDVLICTNDATVDITPFYDPAGMPRVVFVANRSREIAAPRIALDAYRLTDPFTKKATIAGPPEGTDDDGTALLTLAPFEIRMFTVG